MERQAADVTTATGARHEPMEVDANMAVNEWTKSDWTLVSQAIESMRAGIATVRHDGMDHGRLSPDAQQTFRATEERLNRLWNDAQLQAH